MFEEIEITSAVEIQRRSYRLLRWVGDAIERGFIRLERAHKYSDEADAAAEWLSEHYANLPADCRPAKRTGEQFARFANHFASYLLTSFDLVDRPGVRLESQCGCFICGRLVAAPHLRAKKIRSRDKQRAERLKVDCLEELALENTVSLSPERAAALLHDPESRRELALATYGKELLRRCSGHSAGPAVLALWRQFAWKPTGSPIPNFELEASAILAAERHLIEALRGGVGPGA